MCKNKYYKYPQQKKQKEKHSSEHACSVVGCKETWSEEGGVCVAHSLRNENEKAAEMKALKENIRNDIIKQQEMNTAVSILISDKLFILS